MEIILVRPSEVSANSAYFFICSLLYVCFILSLKPFTFSIQLSSHI